MGTGLWVVLGKAGPSPTGSPGTAGVLTCLANLGAQCCEGEVPGVFSWGALGQGLPMALKFICWTMTFVALAWVSVVLAVRFSLQGDGLIPDEHFQRG